MSAILAAMLWDGVRTLIGKARLGDRAALDRLYALAQPYLLRLAQRVLGPGWPEKSVSDLTQETWLRAWQGIGDFQGAESDADTGALFRAWLARTMKNVWLNDRRHDNALCRRPPAGIVPLAGDDSAAPGHDPPGGDGTPSENVRRQEQRQLLERAVADLPDPADRDVVRLRFFEGLSFAQIGQRLGRDESTVRYRLQRILEFFGEKLKDLQ